MGAQGIGLCRTEHMFLGERKQYVERLILADGYEEAQEALDAVAIARKHFDRYSFDLIYARPRQTPGEWREELKRAISEAAEHLSLYQLTIEPETPFATMFFAAPC